MRKRFIIVGLAVIFLVFAGAASSALAHGDDSASPDKPVSNHNDTDSFKQDVANHARERATQIRDTVQQRRAQILSDVCERREQHLNQLIPRLSNNATTLLGVMDTIYERVQGFYETGQLTVANYDGLKANADAAQIEAAAAVQTLADYEFDLNCDNAEAGNKMESFRLAANEAKEELKAYRTELVALISALRAEAAESSEEATQTEEEQ